MTHQFEYKIAHLYEQKPTLRVNRNRYHPRYILPFRRRTSHNGDYLLSFIRLITLLGRSGYQEIKVFLCYFREQPCKTHRQMSLYYRGAFFFCVKYEVLQQKFPRIIKNFSKHPRKAIETFQ